MKYTGERQTVGEGNFEEIQHYYASASRFCVNKDVIDGACGVGWGSAFLSRVARKVVGIDVDTNTIRHAKDNFELVGYHTFSNVDHGHMLHPNLQFKVDNILNLSFPNDCADTYVSIETIEHVRETELLTCFKQAHRVLKSGGTYFISTPDFNIFPYRPKNPSEIVGFHFRHYTFEELQSALLSVGFKSVTQIVKPYERSSILLFATK